MVPRGLKIHDAKTNEYVLAAWRNLSIAIWRDSATADAVDELRRMADEIQRCFPQGRSSIHVVCDGAGPPTPEAKDKFVRLMNPDSVLLCGVVILGRGFWASALRSAITGMQLEARRPISTQHHPDIASLVEWMPRPHSERTGVVLHRDQLSSVLETCLAA